MNWLIAFLAMLAACGFSSPNTSDGGVDSGDGSVPVDAQLCFGTFSKVCFNSAGNVPTLPPLLAQSGLLEIDTDFSLLCDANNDRMAQYCVVAGAGFVLPAATTIRAFGSKPLVLLSTMAMVIDGNVDVSSNRGDPPRNAGAGSNPTSCGAGTAVEGESGGYGGSFQGAGGRGGAVSTNNVPTAAPGLSTFPSVLRGGCGGANGSKTNSDAVVGTGGRGGGAVSIIGASIQINGRINASGAGGGGGGANVTLLKCGGGGGGSGGMIVLDTQTPIVPGSGVLYANGGGGGEGGAGPLGTGVGAGMDGQSSTGPTNAGAGGVSNADGGNGGAGSSGTVLPGAPDAGQFQNDGGGGAGGGGAGFIHAPGFTGAAIAPPSKDLPPGSQ